MDKSKLPSRDGIRFDKTLIFQLQRISPQVSKLRLILVLSFGGISLGVAVLLFYSKYDKAAVPATSSSKEAQLTIKLPLPTSIVGQEKRP